MIDGSRASIAAVVALLVAAAAIYLPRLDRAPYYVSADEAHFAAHASALASRGTDLHGNRTPIFFSITDPLTPGHDQRVWYQPMLFYILAAQLIAAPLTETTLRLPLAVIAVVNVGLMFLVARRLLRSTATALLAAVMLALTPAHFLFARQAVDYLLPLPFVLTWLWCVFDYMERRRAAALIAGLLMLGAGVFSYVASWVSMPLLAAITLIATRPPLRHAAAASGAFVTPVILVLLAQAGIGRVLGDMIGRYRIGAEANAGWLDTLLQINVAERVSLYWQYFSPSFLVFAGGADPLMATSRAGVFLVATAVLIAIGAYFVLVSRTRAGLLVLAGFVLAPLPVVLTLPETPAASPGRVLPIVIFGILIAAAGAHALWQSSSPRRALLIGLVAAMPLQFVSFQRDYFGEYQQRSSYRFDPYAMRDVIAAIAEMDGDAAAPAVLLADDGDNKAIRWRFYTLKEHREELWQRTSYFGTEAPGQSIAAGAILVTGAGDRRDAGLLDAGFVKVTQIRDIGGRPAADIYRRIQRTTSAMPAAAVSATNGAAVSSRD